VHNQVENSFPDHNGLSITVTPRVRKKKRHKSSGSIKKNQEYENQVLV